MSNDMFNQALQLVLKHEGGFVNDPLDPGGATNKGITQRVYDSYRARTGSFKNVRNITTEEVRDIYLNNYWRDGACDKIASPLNAVHFDFAVNAGIRQAIRTLQRTVGVKVDGFFGPITQKAVNEFPVEEAIRRYSELRRSFYNAVVVRRPTSRKFLRGWNIRTTATERWASDWLARRNNQDPS